MAPAKERLKKELMAYDGRAVTILSEIAARHRDEKSFLDNVVAMVDAEEENVSSGATWLIKNYLDKGGAFSGSQTAALVTRATKTRSWAAQLHLCQTLGLLAVTEAQAERLMPWLLPLLSHKRPFVRAWSLDVVYHLAERYRRFSTKAETALKSADEDPAASVRARARNLRRRADDTS